MTAASLTPDGRATARPFGLRAAMLASGMLASLLYVFTDVVGGLGYAGYSFYSQGISELMAVEAPSRTLVHALFTLYGVLALAGGIAVFREGRASRLLRVAGAFLVVYAMIGLTSPLFEPIHARGIAPFETAIQHIVLTGLLVLCMLGAMSAGGFASSPAFRRYSFVTIAVFILGGVASGFYGSRLAAELPTPGFGIVERAMIYGFLAWVFVLSLALVRRAELGAPRSSPG